MKIVRGRDIALIPASHEDPKNPGSLKRILLNKLDLLPGRIQMLNWAVLPPGKSFRPHYHEDMQEVFIIVSGEAHMRVGEETISLGPQDVVVIDPKSIHHMKNSTNTNVEYVVFGLSSEQGGKTVVV